MTDLTSLSLAHVTSAFCIDVFSLCRNEQADAEAPLRLTFTCGPFLPVRTVLDGLLVAELDHGRAGLVGQRGDGAGYGLAWFAAPQPEHHVAKVFLPRSYQPSLARALLEERVADIQQAHPRRMGQRAAHRCVLINEALRGEAWAADEGDPTLDPLRSFEALSVWWAGVFGEVPPADAVLGYDPAASATLAAIHARFVELYAAWLKGNRR